MSINKERLLLGAHQIKNYLVTNQTANNIIAIPSQIADCLYLFI